jgi:hypothetical protein
MNCKNCGHSKDRHELAARALSVKCAGDIITIKNTCPAYKICQCTGWTPDDMESRKFKESLGSFLTDDWKDITYFSDGIGFSLQREYPTDSPWVVKNRKTPPEADTRALLKIIKKSDTTMDIMLCKFSRWRMNHSVYFDSQKYTDSKEWEDSPDIDEVQQATKCPQPQEIWKIDGEIVSGEQLVNSLNTLWENHLHNNTQNKEIINEKSCKDRLKSLVGYFLADVIVTNIATNPVEAFASAVPATASIQFPILGEKVASNRLWIYIIVLLLKYRCPSTENIDFVFCSFIIWAAERCYKSFLEWRRTIFSKLSGIRYDPNYLIK